MSCLSSSITYFIVFDNSTGERTSCRPLRMKGHSVLRTLHIILGVRNSTTVREHYFTDPWRLTDSFLAHRGFALILRLTSIPTTVVIDMTRLGNFVDSHQSLGWRQLLRVGAFMCLFFLVRLVHLHILNVPVFEVHGYVFLVNLATQIDSPYFSCRRILQALLLIIAVLKVILHTAEIRFVRIIHGILRTVLSVKIRVFRFSYATLVPFRGDL